MPVKNIPHTDIPGATKLSPLEMNKITFETGHHSDIPEHGPSDSIVKPS